MFFTSTSGPVAGFVGGADKPRGLRNKGRRLEFEALESREVLTAWVSPLSLVSDSGISATDRVTNDPRVSAMVSWDPAKLSQVVVQFDHNGDGQAEGSLSVSQPGAVFLYDPLAVDAVLNGWEGPLALKYRTVGQQAGGTVASSWQTFQFTLDRVAPAPLQIGPGSDSQLTSSPASLTVTYHEALDPASVSPLSVLLTDSVETVVGLSTVSLSGTSQVVAEIGEQDLHVGVYETTASYVRDLAGNWLQGPVTSVWTLLSPPTATVVAPVAVDEDSESTTISLFKVFEDVETADENLLLAVTQNSNSGLFSSVTIDPETGVLTLSYAANAFGTAQLTVQATDEHGLTVATPINVTVNPVNDPPQIVDFVAVEGPTVWSFEGTVHDENPGATEVLFTGLFEATATVQQDGSFFYTVVLTQDGLVSLQARDSAGLLSNIREYFVHIT
ncbi:MAG: hypothetical protein J5I93_16510 [Pirellulaceae bacterium]|nr:hypothetical protein [Pirellulaceae bacterium]